VSIEQGNKSNLRELKDKDKFRSGLQQDACAGGEDGVETEVELPRDHLRRETEERGVQGQALLRSRM